RGARRRARRAPPVRAARRRVRRPRRAAAAVRGALRRGGRRRARAPALRAVRRHARRSARPAARPARPLPVGDRVRHRLDARRTGGAGRPRRRPARRGPALRGRDRDPAQVAAHAHEASGPAGAGGGAVNATNGGARTFAGSTDAARIVLRPLGNPLPLGFLALAAGTLLLSGLQLGWLQPSDGQDVALILIAFVFPLQLLSATF